MANSYVRFRDEKEDLRAEPSMINSNSDSSESTPSSMPPPYSYPTQYPQASGMPHPQQYSSQGTTVGYPQPYVPHYAQPGGVYPGPQGLNYCQAPQQQQQQQTVVVNNQPGVGAPVYLVNQPPVSMTGAIVLACVTYWCFGMVFGGIAFVLAMNGQTSVAEGDTRSAIRMRNASYGVSIAGIIIGVITIAVIIGVIVSAAKNNDCIFSHDPNTESYRFSCRNY